MLMCFLTRLMRKIFLYSFSLNLSNAIFHGWRVHSQIVNTIFNFLFILIRVTAVLGREGRHLFFLVTFLWFHTQDRYKMHCFKWLHISEKNWNLCCFVLDLSHKTILRNYNGTIQYITSHLKKGCLAGILINSLTTSLRSITLTFKLSFIACCYRTQVMLAVRSCLRIWRCSSVQWLWWYQTDRSSWGWNWLPAASWKMLFWLRNSTHFINFVKNSCPNRYILTLGNIKSD